MTVPRILNAISPRKIAYALLTYACSIIVAANAGVIGSGTVVGYIYTDDFFIIGSDSRRSLKNQDGAVIDSSNEVCKLVAINQHGAFSAIGITFGSQNGRHFTTESVMEYTLANDPPSGFRDIVENWSNAISHNLSIVVPNAMGQRLLTRGIFGMQESSGNLAGYTSRIYADLGIARPTISHIVDPLPKTSEIRTFEYDDEIGEFLRGETERAKRTNAEMQLEPCAGDAECAARTMKYAIKAMIDWKVSPDVGGQPATVILKRDDLLRWYARPSFCRERTKDQQQK